MLSIAFAVLACPPGEAITIQIRVAPCVVQQSAAVQQQAYSAPPAPAAAAVQQQAAQVQTYTVAAPPPVVVQQAVPQIVQYETVRTQQIAVVPTFVAFDSFSSYGHSRSGCDDFSRGRSRSRDSFDFFESRSRDFGSDFERSRGTGRDSRFVRAEAHDRGGRSAFAEASGSGRGKTLIKIKQRGR